MGMTTACFHNRGILPASKIFWKRKQIGEANVVDVFLNKQGGRPSGPGEPKDFSLFIKRRTWETVKFTSEIVVTGTFSINGVLAGSSPSSLMQIEEKYVFKASAISSLSCT